MNSPLLAEHSASLGKCAGGLDRWTPLLHNRAVTCAKGHHLSADCIAGGVCYHCLALCMAFALKAKLFPRKP